MRMEKNLNIIPKWWWIMVMNPMGSNPSTITNETNESRPLVFQIPAEKVFWVGI